MSRLLTLIACLSAAATLSAGAKIDKRLYTMKKVFVVPADDLGDDKPVAVCVADRLPKLAALEAVQTKDEADVVLKVKAHLPGQTARHALGSMGGRPSGEVTAELPDGTKLWSDGAKLGSGFSWDSGLKTQDNQTTECAIAAELINTLRDAMRKARDQK